MRTTNYNHCKVYWMSLILIVGVNILGVKCDIKTDFPKSGHIYSAVLVTTVLYWTLHVGRISYTAVLEVHCGSNDPHNPGHSGHFFARSSRSHPQKNYLDVTQIDHVRLIVQHLGLARKNGIVEPGLWAVIYICLFWAMQYHTRVVGHRSISLMTAQLAI